MKHGGNRKGAGRKRKYKESSEVVSFRIPISKIKKIRSLVNSELLKYEATR